RRSWTQHAVEGNSVSCEHVPTMMPSSSPGSIPASRQASAMAPAARSDVEVFSSTTRRAPIPVRSRIQASEVSRRSARSSLVTTLSGRQLPVPRNFKRLTKGPPRKPPPRACPRSTRLPRSDRGGQRGGSVAAASRPERPLAPRCPRRAVLCAPRIWLLDRWAGAASGRAPGSSALEQLVEVGPLPHHRLGVALELGLVAAELGRVVHATAVDHGHV